MNAASPGATVVVVRRISSAGKIIASALADSRKDAGTFAELLAQDPAARAAIEPVALSTLDVPDAYLGSAEHFRRRLISGLGTNTNG